jgi:hypothetical protein
METITKLVFKEEEDFKTEFGETWRSGPKSSIWNWGEQKDYLFGLLCKPEWVGRMQNMYPELAPKRDGFWGVEAWMVREIEVTPVQDEDISKEIESAVPINL